ncbi:Alpha-monoglucosyldiacylglycerol synthase [Corynebacterium atrinae]|uniref:glycosyltransferase n=1 Tax=Corynebacterium atrinae TaxID=1336740 RepID=UPI0025B4542C|nr:glycosyltransferase [Corynebacterium atrinae]WJY62159.1 Alpha-monoglucosyldiacylglycerol synthase [Corynebacterium atrinae]
MVRRVAVVSDYSLTTLGGAETAFAEQVSLLSAVAEVLAVCPPSRRLDELAVQEGVDKLAVPVTFVVPGLGFPVARNSPKLRALLRKAFADVEVVHVHSEFGIAAAAIAAARELEIPVVQTVHTFFWQTTAPVQTLLALGGPPVHRLLTGWRSPARQLAQKKGDSALRNMTLAAAQAVDRVISPSAHQAEHLSAAGLRHIDVLPNAVSHNAAAEPLNSIDGPLRVLWIGRFCPEKRIFDFLRACQRALDEVGPDKLLIDVLGTGPQFPAAQRLVREQPGIRLHGRVPHADIPAWLERSHVTAVTSIGWDNQPMTIAESVMALRGVIWCDPALTEGVVPAGIPAFDGTLADRLIELARDPGAVVAASQSAVEASAIFSPEYFTRSVLDVYRHAILSPDSERTP